MAKHLLIFARHPALGLVKTRLAYTVGEAEALRVYEELLDHTRAAADGVAATKTLWLAGEPPLGPNAFTEWQAYEQRPQPTGELGERMHQAFGAAFAEGATRCVIIGTDCPELTSTHLEQAFAHLASHDVVVGPALDGGYYLLGMNTLIPDFFQNKAWSTDTVLADTLADADRLGLRVAQLPPLSDVDTASDLLAWQSRRG
ncbi:TIGR04282 family arsenosugar biosynthesis glycosyltransferase [Hymenobacter cellulosivorans]|uniref:TIGR04282 family arsenosugar biosynthesis glycosyltransferase n=1 Tax=Hymenobacter cellulosivorans TaxID=2932249 RepID=A0ABY4F8F4_9BACT|nr:TIGR04282 family arsenosugar biosynthesis glycosyltransferase [Hymenobacter cellulosivorans]UOQ50741.1 TIGR04282 family arsenosugar biosynthesis glycosyltransferase [Hymenobacter cellulosivorans]